jgi:hypothetical protein
MSLHALDNLNYSGNSGVYLVRQLQQNLTLALQQEDWQQVRRLDQACASLIEKVIAANKDDGSALVMALSELKGVYSSLIVQCKREVASMAH